MTISQRIVLGYTAIAVIDGFAPVSTTRTFLNLITQPALQPTLDRVLDGPFISSLSILGTRMMLNVRETGANAQPRLDINTMHVSNLSNAYEMHDVVSRIRQLR